MKRGLTAVVLLAVLISMLSLAAAAPIDKIAIKFFSKGDGRGVTVDLQRYLGTSSVYYHSLTHNVAVSIKGSIAEILPNQGWVGDEIIVFALHESAVRTPDLGDEEPINLEPVIETFIPEQRRFSASDKGQIQFTLIAYDPDDDLMYIDWYLDGKIVKKESTKGGVISHYILNGDTNSSEKGIKNFEFNESEQQHVITVVLNDTTHIKSVEWRFNIENLSCTDEWECSEWSGCTQGKRNRTCTKMNPECAENTNLPPDEKIDPSCFSERSCNPNWTCGDWDACTVNYNFDIIANGTIADALKTKQQRVCYDSTYCIGNVGIETRDCNNSIPVAVTKTLWCSEPYVEIYDSSSGLFVSRIRESRLEPRFDIDLSLRQLSRDDFCWYCYDGKKDFDETDADCGGSCMDCTGEETHAAITSYVRTFLFSFFDIILLFSIVAVVRRM